MCPVCLELFLPSAFPVSADGMATAIASCSVYKLLSCRPYYHVTGFPCCYFSSILRDLSRDWDGLGDLGLGSSSVVQSFLYSLSQLLTPVNLT